MQCENDHVITKMVCLALIIVCVSFATGYRQGVHSITMRARFETNIKERGFFYPFRLELDRNNSDATELIEDISKDAVITGATEVVTKRIAELMEKRGSVTTKRKKS